MAVLSDGVRNRSFKGYIANTSRLIVFLANETFREIRNLPMIDTVG